MSTYYVNNDEIVDEDGNVVPKYFWLLIDTYFEENGLVRQQLSSFNSFIRKAVEDVIPSPTFQFQINNSERLGINPSDEETHRYELTNGICRYPQTPIPGGTPESLLPHEARLRNTTYASRLHVDITETISREGVESTERKFQHVEFALIPVMIKSALCRLRSMSDIDFRNFNECRFDQGGYFIVNGSEKVVIAQEKMAPNTVLVFEGSDSNKYPFEGNINSLALNDEVRSHKLRMDYPKDPNNIKDVREKDPKIKVPVLSMSRMEVDVPVVILFIALGFETDEQIVNAICYDKNDSKIFNIVTTAIQVHHNMNTENALDWIGSHSTKSNRGVHETKTENREKLVRDGREKLKKDLLPHVGVDNFERKAQFLGYMVNHFLSVYTEKRNADDRDHIARKRMLMTGSLMMDLFKNSLKRVMKKARESLQHELDHGREMKVVNAFKTSTIYDDMKKALSTGNWPQPGNNKEPRHGVAQVLSRITFTSALSYLRKISSPVEGKRKTQKPRQLHNTQWGYICPAETPEGEQCGLVKMLSLMSQITVALPLEDINNISDVLKIADDIEQVPSDELISTTKVFLNGAWVKCTNEPENLLEELKDFRRNQKKGKVKKVMSMVLDHLNRELRIYTDAGRCTRPLFTVSEDVKGSGRFRLNLKGKHILDLCRKMRERKMEVSDRKGNESIWKKFLSEGIVEYVDADEEEMSMIAMFPSDLNTQNVEGSFKSYTHCEINPALVMGILGGIIPFPDHNQSPRNTYQCAMGKQAIGVYASNYQLRMDTLGHVLFYPQQPLVSTHASNYVKIGFVPAGINAIVAICCYSGYNQEDSVMMNQSSIDRGFFRSMSLKTFSEECSKNDSIVFVKPSEGTTDFMEDSSKYDKLDADGLVCPGTKLRPDDIMIGAFLHNTKTGKLKDCSVRYKPRENGVVDQVVVMTNENSARFVRVKVRSIRIPQIGDKFSSRHGQKGTVGMTYRQEDMPFTLDGISPDIIMNPHAIPSRMTVGQLVECLLGKVVAINGIIENATPFSSDITVESVARRLHKFGFQHHGYEALFSGHTGRKLDTLVFIGPTYYQRLKHLVDDKVHGRATGPYATLTRQPLEGRSRDGGLRLGEMERDCMISHGMSALLRERLFLASDRYQVYVCDKCHMPAVANVKTNAFECSTCKDRTHISKVEIPYAAKLLFQELMAMAICPRIYAEM